MRRGLRLVLVAQARGAAPQVNTYGTEWHVWVLQLIGSQTLPKYISEWRPTPWDDSEALLCGMLVAVAVIATAIRRKGTTAAEALVVLFWVTKIVGIPCRFA